MKNKYLLISIVLIPIFIIVLLVLFRPDQVKGKIYIEKKYYNNSGLVSTNEGEIKSLLDDKKSFIVFTYNSYCSFSKPCEEVFHSISKELNISILQIPFEEFKNTDLYKTIKYGPSIIIINKGKIYKYLDPNKDEDLNRFQNKEDFSNWLLEYVQK